jgi:hypothetical protein
MNRLLNWLRARLLQPPAAPPAASPPITAPRMYLPEDIARATAGFVASYGTSAEPHEGIAYWAGVAMPESSVVTTVIAPGAITTPGSYRTSAVGNARVIQAINRHHLQLLAQVHGHPEEWVGHSAGDDTGAFMPYAGFYSIVIPAYGRRGLLPLSKCGVHRYDGDRFVQLSEDEIADQIVLVPTAMDLRDPE